MRLPNETVLWSLNCLSCGESRLEDGGFIENRCVDCHLELAHGIIPPAYGYIVDECEEDLDDECGDDDLADEGEQDNAVRVYEDDMPDASQYGYRDTSLSDECL